MNGYGFPDSGSVPVGRRAGPPMPWAAGAATPRARPVRLRAPPQPGLDLRSAHWHDVRGRNLLTDSVGHGPRPEIEGHRQSPRKCTALLVVDIADRLGSAPLYRIHKMVIRNLLCQEPECSMRCLQFQEPECSQKCHQSQGPEIYNILLQIPLAKSIPNILSRWIVHHQEVKGHHGPFWEWSDLVSLDLIKLGRRLELTCAAS